MTIWWKKFLSWLILCIEYKVSSSIILSLLGRPFRHPIFFCQKGFVIRSSTTRCVHYTSRPISHLFWAMMYVTSIFSWLGGPIAGIRAIFWFICYCQPFTLLPRPLLSPCTFKVVFKLGWYKMTTPHWSVIFEWPTGCYKTAVEIGNQRASMCFPWDSVAHL